MSGSVEEIRHGLRLKVVHGVNRYETTMTSDDVAREIAPEQKDEHKNKKKNQNENKDK